MSFKLKKKKEKFPTTTQELKSHYLGDWHRYNLKRKGAEMPPVSEDNFARRVAELKKQEDLEHQKNLFQGQCERTFNFFLAMYH